MSIPEEWSVPEPVAIKLDRSSDALIVVDLQREYCHPRGRKYLETSQEILPNVIRLLDVFRAHGAWVFFTKVHFDPKDPRFAGLESRTYPRKGEWGFELVDELNLTPTDVVVEKDCYDPFLSSELEAALKSRGLKPERSTIVVAGAVTTTCVYHTVSGLFHRGYRVVVPVDCVADRTPAAQLFGLWKFSSLYNVKLTRSDLIEIISSPPGDKAPQPLR